MRAVALTAPSTLVLFLSPGLETVVAKMSSTATNVDNNSFNYFAYGSNLLANRIHINNPTAVRKTNAKLKGYRLDFAGYSRRWGGSVATIEPDDHSTMWGAVWKIDASNLKSLDRQEGVHLGVYNPLTISVTTADGEVLQCRTYRYNHNRRGATTTNVAKVHSTGSSPAPYSNLPTSRRPSPLYLETIQRGAAESQLPQSYKTLLSSIPNNGHDAGITLDQFLADTTLTNKDD